MPTKRRKQPNHCDLNHVLAPLGTRCFSPRCNRELTSYKSGFCLKQFDDLWFCSITCYLYYLDNKRLITLRRLRKGSTIAGVAGRLLKVKKEEGWNTQTKPSRPRGTKLCRSFSAGPVILKEECSTTLTVTQNSIQNPTSNISLPPDLPPLEDHN